MTLECIPFDFDAALFRPSRRPLSEEELTSGVLNADAASIADASDASSFSSSSHENVSLELLRFTPQT